MEVIQCRSSILLAIILMVSLTQGFSDYITKPYFEKYISLDEFDFEKFIDSEVLFSSSSILADRHNKEPKLLASHRNLIGEGSHRHLVTSMTLDLELFGHSCAAIVVERLPSGVFADPFELQGLVRRGVLKDAAVFGDTNLELPSFRSNRSLVEVHVEITPEMYSTNKLQLQLMIELPLHARYQPLCSGFSVVEFGQPDVLLRCRMEENPHKPGCLLVLSGQSANSQAGHIVWEVPCGNKEHEKMVSVVTFASALLSALLIVFASFSYSNPAFASHLKQF